MAATPNISLASLEGHVERIKYILPSSYRPDELKKYELLDLAETERKLREARAHDALRELRISIKRRVLGIKMKKSKKAGRGQKPNTRMEAKIRALEARVRIYRDEYRRMHSALLQLGMSPDNGTLQELTKEDMAGAAIGDTNYLGQGKAHLSWIWRVGPGDDEKDPKWALEGKPNLIKLV